MNLHQLQSILEIVRCKMNMSNAAVALGTSQPAISHQVRLLEEELGVPVFLRTRNRLTGLTSHGETIVECARRALSEIAEIQAVARVKNISRFTTIRVASTHAQGRY